MSIGNRNNLAGIIRQQRVIRGLTLCLRPRAPKFIIPLAITVGLVLAGYTGGQGTTLPNELEITCNDTTSTEPRLLENADHSEIVIPTSTLSERPPSNLSQTRQTRTAKEAVPVAVLDSGIDADHEDLKGLIIAEADFTDSSSPTDIYGHGTHVAGIIAAENDDVGIAGVAPCCRLLNAKVADDVGRCQAEALAQGIIWAVNNGAKVINISLEIREHSPQLEEAVNYAWNEGAIIIAATGNEGNQLPVYPAYYKNCIAVAATKQDGKLAPLSNYGDWVDVGAPGFKVYSCLPENSYGYKTGTSFACAYVSGIAALLFGVVSDTNGDGRLNDEVRAAIETGYGLNFGQRGADPEY